MYHAGRLVARPMYRMRYRTPACLNSPLSICRRCRTDYATACSGAPRSQTRVEVRECARGTGGGGRDESVGAIHARPPGEPHRARAWLSLSDREICFQRLWNDLQVLKQKRDPTSVHEHSEVIVLTALRSFG